MKGQIKKLVAMGTFLSLTASLTACSTDINPQLNQLLLNNNNSSTFSSFSTTKNKLSIKASNYKTIYDNQYIVKFRNNKADFTILSNHNLKVKGSIPQLGMQVVQAPGNLSSSVINKIKGNSNVLSFEPNYVIKLIPDAPTKSRVEAPPADEFVPNDPLFSKQYAPQLVQAPKAWEMAKRAGQCGPAIISIIDTGVDLEHPDLKTKLLPGKDFVDGDNIPQDGNSHGTHCSGIAAAITNNNEGIVGMAPNSKILPVRVLDDRGSGSLADVANGITWAADHGASVLSLSLGAPYGATAMEEAVKYALSKDAVVVVAMGNSGKEQKYYPAAYPGVTAVISTDSSDQRSYFSTYGPWASVAAPGSGILSSIPGGKYGSKSGTSMACPAAAGVIALIRSKFPEMTNIQVKERLEKTADDKGEAGFDKFFGHGRVNAYRALFD